MSIRHREVTHGFETLGCVLTGGAAFGSLHGVSCVVHCFLPLLAVSAPHVSCQTLAVREGPLANPDLVSAYHVGQLVAHQDQVWQGFVCCLDPSSQ